MLFRFLLCSANSCSIVQILLSVGRSIPPRLHCGFLWFAGVVCENSAVLLWMYANNLGLGNFLPTASTIPIVPVKIIARSKNYADGDELSQRTLCEKYKVSKDIVYNILQRKEERSAYFQVNTNKGIKRKLKCSLDLSFSMS